MLGLSARRGAAFFSSYGLRVGPMWRSFCTTLQAQTPLETEDAVVEAARDTFIAMHRWLCA
jgi:heme oxygenase